MEHDDVIGRLRSLSRQQVDSRLASAQLARATAAAAAGGDGRRRAVLTAACLVAVALPAAGIAWARAGGGSGPADRPVVPAVASTAPALIGDEPPSSTPASTSVPVPTSDVALRNSDVTPARPEVASTPSSFPGVSTPTDVVRPTDDLQAPANEAAPDPPANVPGPPTTQTRPSENLPAPANEAAPGPPAGVPGPPDGLPAPVNQAEPGANAEVPGPPEGVPGPPEGMPEQAANGQGG